MDPRSIYVRSLYTRIYLISFLREEKIYIYNIPTRTRTYTLKSDRTILYSSTNGLVFMQKRPRDIHVVMLSISTYITRLWAIKGNVKVVVVDGVFVHVEYILSVSYTVLNQRKSGYPGPKCVFS